MFNVSHAESLIELALAEDFGDEGDVTSDALIPLQMQASARFVMRDKGRVAGLPIVELVRDRIDKTLHCQWVVNDGDELAAGTPMGTLTGSLRSILKLERVALNFLQRLCGIATLTQRYLEAVKPYSARVLDTRKTTPGWRHLEKYAVECGGGVNHRVGLYDMILIKDNHLAGLSDHANPLAHAIQQARTHFPSLTVEIEVDTLEQFQQALHENPDIILLDNMSNEQLRTAVSKRNEAKSSCFLEASGGVNLTTIRDIAATGVDRISVGAITHSATALDIGLDFGTITDVR